MMEPTRTSQPASVQLASVQLASVQLAGDQIGPGMGFTLANGNGDRVVYIANDPALNTLTLTLTNQTGAALTLKGGVPVPEEQIASQGPTSLYLSFGGLLTPDQIKALQVSAPGWQAQLLSGTVTSWVLTPASDLAIPDKGTVAVTIAHLIVSGSPRPGALTVDYFNVPGVDDDASQQVLSVQMPPSQPRDLALDVELMGSNVVYVSRDPANPIVNTLVLSVVNPSPDRALVPAGTPPPPDPPIFYLSFVYGTRRGYGALTTAGLGQTIQVDPIGQTTDTWTPERVDQTEGPYWRLRPQQPEVLGTGAASRVGFVVSHIVTELEPELLPTPMYLQWANIPGYNDGYQSLDVVKSLPTPGILAFRALTPEIISAGKPVELTWQTFAVTHLALSFRAGKEIVALDSAAGTIGLNADRFTLTPAPLTDTTYYLDAFDAHGTKIDSQSIPITVVDPPIQIDAFSASPPAANFRVGPVDVTLRWSATPAQIVSSLEIEGLADVTGSTSYLVKGVRQAGQFSLRAIGLAGDQHVAVAAVQQLQDYLVGRTYGLVNYQDDDADNERWVTDKLEIVSASEARYTVALSTWHDIEVRGGQVAPGYPRVYSGPWTLTGNTIQLPTALGVLQFVYQDDPYEGEILDFRTPTLTHELPSRDDLHLKPGAPRP